MEVSIAHALTALSELVRRAEAGDDVVILRDGRAAVRLVRVHEAPALDPDARRRALMDIWERGRSQVPLDFDAARSQDFLYGDDGLPA